MKFRIAVLQPRRQTTSCLAENDELLDETVVLGLTNHLTDDEQERSEISEATNSQNPVSP